MSSTSRRKVYRIDAVPRKLDTRNGGNVKTIRTQTANIRRMLVSDSDETDQVVILFYADDVVILRCLKTGLKYVMNKLRSLFNVTDLGK